MTYISSTYLKDVIDYDLKFIINDLNSFYIVVKKINKIKNPFILNEDGIDIKILDNGYYILEFVPINKNYISRIYIDNNGEVVERMFIITLNNNLDNGIPIYKDMKLSYVCVNENKKIYNLDKFNQMLNSSLISLEEYNKSLKELEIIKEEINNKTNYFYNLDYKIYLF